MGKVILEGAEEAFGNQMADLSSSSAGWWCRHIKISAHIDASAKPDLAGMASKLESISNEKEITVFVCKDKDCLVLYKPAEKDSAMRITLEIWSAMVPSYQDSVSGQDKQYNEDLSVLDDVVTLTMMVEGKLTQSTNPVQEKKITPQEAQEKMAARDTRIEKKFLLIADNPDIISAIYSAIPLKEIEKKFTKAEIIGANDLQDAIHKYYEHFPDIVLLDDSIKTGMNTATGKEVYKWIQFIASYDPASYIILLSEHAATAYVKKVLNLGGKALVRKPFTNTIITKHVAYALENKKKAQETVASLI
jgi:CheY-like chemotaxis protein